MRRLVLSALVEIVRCNAHGTAKYHEISGVSGQGKGMELRGSCEGAAAAKDSDVTNYGKRGRIVLAFIGRNVADIRVHSRKHQTHASYHPIFAHAAHHHSIGPVDLGLPST